MKIIAIDDERLQLETILEYLSELYPDAECIGFHMVSKALEYLEQESADLAILDIDMPGSINGIDLGHILRQKNSRIKLLYCTGYTDYAMDAYRMHANGYLQKPIMKEALRRELAYIMQMPVFDMGDKPYINTFGKFDLYVKERPVSFKRSKSKEILAYLTDRRGAWVTNRELVVALWEGARSDFLLAKYISTLVKELKDDLESAGAGHIVERQRGQLRLLKQEVVCDYYAYLREEAWAKERFHNEYMAQYSWGEGTLARLFQSKS